MAALQTANDEETFCPDWFSQYGIQGFLIRHIDVESTQLLDLETSIFSRGYDPDQPIILARSKDPVANGYVEDGRNRLIVCDRIFKKTGKLPDITTRNENVPDLSHAKLRQIFFESQHLTKKTAKVAKEHILTLYDEIKSSSPQLFKQKTIEEVLRMDGRFDDEIKLKVIIAELQRIERTRKDEDSRSAGASGSQSRWHTDENETKADTKEKIKSYASEVEIRCEGCGRTHNYPVNVKVSDAGIAKVESL